MPKKVILIPLKISNAICWPLPQKGAGLICFDFGRILGSYNAALTWQSQNRNKFKKIIFGNIIGYFLAGI